MTLWSKLAKCWIVGKPSFFCIYSAVQTAWNAELHYSYNSMSFKPSTNINIAISHDPVVQIGQMLDRWKALIFLLYSAVQTACNAELHCSYAQHLLNRLKTSNVLYLMTLWSKLAKCWIIGKPSFFSSIPPINLFGTRNCIVPTPHDLLNHLKTIKITISQHPLVQIGQMLDH